MEGRQAGNKWHLDDPRLERVVAEGQIVAEYIYSSHTRDRKLASDPCRQLEL